MANDAKRTSQLGVVTAVSANDRVVVLTNPTTAAQTQTISVVNFINAFPTANSSQSGVVKLDSNTIVISNGVIYANNVNFVGLTSAANVVSNNQLLSNLANYQTTAGLSANIAMLTSNAANFIGIIPAANVVSNNQLSTNLANYALLANGLFTGTVNATSHTVGTAFTANSTLVNAAAINVMNQTNTGTLYVTASVTVLSNTFNLGSPTKAANGYTYLSNGLLYQWGTVSANSTTGNATFTVAFPTACQSVTLSVIGSANIAYQVASPNTTVATIRTSSTTTAINVQYQAIGY